nr:acyl-CoA dehydrogenase family protein [Streptomyces sp. MMG1121]
MRTRPRTSSPGYGRAARAVPTCRTSSTCTPSRRRGAARCDRFDARPLDLRGRHAAAARRPAPGPRGSRVSAPAAARALPLRGGYGRLSEQGIEKIVRDLRAHRILEGTNEIMRVIVARGLTEALG